MTFRIPGAEDRENEHDTLRVSEQQRLRPLSPRGGRFGSSHMQTDKETHMQTDKETHTHSRAHLVPPLSLNGFGVSAVEEVEGGASADGGVWWQEREGGGGGRPSTAREFGDGSSKWGFGGKHS